jgi:predicted permease
VLATLALGIAATVTVFSIVDAWLLRPLSFPDADRLVIGLYATHERPVEPALFMLFRDYLGAKERSRSFEVVFAAFPRAHLMSGTGEATTASGLVVTEDFFQTLGVPARVGRTLSARDVTGPSAVVLSDGLWQRQFGASDAVVGTSLTLNSVPHVIVGVMPRQFDVRMLEQARGFELWTLFRPDEQGYGPGGTGGVALFGRLRQRVPIDVAQVELASIHRDIESAYARNAAQYGVLLTSLQADNTRSVRGTLTTVAGAVVCLLLIACLNVGALLLGRGLSRAREAAIRAAIGCGRGRLVRQFLTESLLLSLIGGSGGLVLTLIATRLFAAWNPLSTLPANPVQIDWRVLGFAGVVMVLSTVLCGLVPALRMSATHPADALRVGGQRGAVGAPAQRAQALLLAGQIGASVVLLVATILLIRTFVRLHNEPLGFDIANLTIASVSLPAEEFDTSARRSAFYRQLADGLEALPGVRRVAASTSLPLSSGPPVSVRTGGDDAESPLRLSAQDVSVGFFETLGIPVVTGRAFDARDSITGPSVVVLNENAARVLFGSASSAVGRRIRIDQESWRVVIGVVRNVRSAFFNKLEWQISSIMYLPAPQAFAVVRSPTTRSFELHFQVRADRRLSMSEVKTAAASLSSRVAVTQVGTASESAAEATKQPALRMALLGWFAAASLVLAAIGVYGLVSQSVAERMREIGIRLALGAGTNDVIGTVTRRVVVAAAIGLVGGSAAALAMASTLQALLYGVRATDAVSFIYAGMAMLIVTAIAAFVPALRATRIDPAQVLRGD